MKVFKIPISFIFLAIFTVACSEKDKEEEIPIVPQYEYSVKASITHNYNSKRLQFNSSAFPFPQGTKFSSNVLLINEFRYILSDIKFHKPDNTFFLLDEYFVIDQKDTNDIEINPTTKVPEGIYTDISLTLGFNQINNSKTYPELDSSGWKWYPDCIKSIDSTLEAGYRFMQIKGLLDKRNGDTIPINVEMGTACDKNLELVIPNHMEVEFSSQGNFEIDSDYEFRIFFNIEQWIGHWDYDWLCDSIHDNFGAQRSLNSSVNAIFIQK